MVYEFQMRVFGFVSPCEFGKNIYYRHTASFAESRVKRSRKQDRACEIQVFADLGVCSCDQNAIFGFASYRHNFF